MSMVDYDPNALDEGSYVTPQMQQATARAAQLDQITSLGESLKAEYGKRVNDRKAVELRWLEDLRLYNSQYDEHVLAEIRLNGGSEVFLSIGRTKTDAVEAHHSNLLLPTDERNWDIDPSPVPEMAPLEGSNAQIHTTPQGAPVTAGDLVDGLRAEAEQRCDRMRTQIDDQLSECDYSRHVRKTLHQGCVLGTGVMRGPILKNKKRKRWQHAKGSDRQNPIWVRNATADTRPAIENVNVWDFYPSGGIGDITQTEGVYVRHWVTRQQLRDLQYEVDFMQEQISDLLSDHPTTPTITNDTIIQLRLLSGEVSVMQSGFEMVEFSGVVDTAALIACGLKVPDNPLDAYKASIFMIDGKVIKAALELMEDCLETEFYVWQLARDDTTIWGKGVPRLMRTSVLIANAVFRMMIDNAGLAVGGQLVYDNTRIVPADGDPRMTPRKVWFKVGEDNVQLDSIFKIFEIPPQIEWLQPLFNLAIRLCDDESALPMIAQGDQAAHITKTKGGMSMLMDAAGVMLRRSVKGFDDNITIPVIDAMYAWNMLYSQDQTIKGDYTTKARGSSALLEREQQMESFTQFIQFLNSNPLFQKAADWPSILEEGTRLLRMNRNSLLLPVEKIKQIVMQMQQNPQQPPPDPRIVVAQINAKAAQTNAEIAAQSIELVAKIKAGTDQSAINATMNKLAQEIGLERDKLDTMLGLKNKELDQTAQMFNADKAAQFPTTTSTPEGATA